MNREERENPSEDGSGDCSATEHLARWSHAEVTVTGAGHHHNDRRQVRAIIWC